MRRQAMTAHRTPLRRHRGAPRTLTLVALLGLAATCAATLGSTSAVAASQPSAAGTSASASPLAAVVDPSAEGLWYYTAPGLEGIHRSVTGEGITVAVIDGPVNVQAPSLVGTDLVTQPRSGCDEEDGSKGAGGGVSTDVRAEHATGMISLIIGNGAGADGQPGVLGVAPGARVLHFSRYDEDGCYGPNDSFTGFADAVDDAIAAGADIISNSWSREYGVGTDIENEALARAQREGVIVVAASPHDGSDALQWPASANGVIAVESADASLQRSDNAVASPQLGVVAPGEGIRSLRWSDGAWNTYDLTNGSSNATAWTAGALALAWSAHPDATANQIIQSLLRTTSGHNGELLRDDTWGYGVVNVDAMVTTDPTTYPDTNPLLLQGEGLQPSYEDVLGGGQTATPAPDQTQTPTAAPKPERGDKRTDTDGLSPLLLVGGGALALALVAGVVVAVVRSRQRPGPPNPPTFTAPRAP
ncbi:S8 family peptidase [Actinotalea subterranea]|uniref:S8 family peptidase n=1 Tax=Actinotalea subterranea TaxID=2607497 RepID=UPI0011EE3E5B|nr:S8/S53 family peptidase [Actinotalea subterranea]